jgi:hypothetical protein
LIKAANMDFDSWHVDIAEATVRHPSGFRIVVEGNLADPTGISPSNFPEGLSAAEQARLVRCGMQALMKAARSRTTVRRPRPTVAAKPRFKDKPERPVLSLKR